MNYSEWLYILDSDLHYIDYCDYLKTKYGQPPYAYFRPDWTRCSNNSRIVDGLFIHHVAENSHIQLSTVEFAREAPYDVQLPEFLVYCDYLEHLWLHMLIFSEYGYPYGGGGVQNYMIPELFRLYNGINMNVPKYKQICFDKVRNDFYCFQRMVYFWCTFLYELQVSTYKKKVRIKTDG